jgi:integrase
MTAAPPSAALALSPQGRAVLGALPGAANGQLPIAAVFRAVHRADTRAAVERASLSRTLRRLWRAGGVLTSPRTGKPYHNIDKVFARALERAKITSGDVTPHTLRHTAISRMVAAGIDATPSWSSSAT